MSEPAFGTSCEVKNVVTRLQVMDSKSISGFYAISLAANLQVTVIDDELVFGKQKNVCFVPS